MSLYVSCNDSFPQTFFACPQADLMVVNSNCLQCNSNYQKLNLTNCCLIACNCCLKQKSLVSAGRTVLVNVNYHELTANWGELIFFNLRIIYGNSRSKSKKEVCVSARGRNNHSSSEQRRIIQSKSV